MWSSLSVADLEPWVSRCNMHQNSLDCSSWYTLCPTQLTGVPAFWSPKSTDLMGTPPLWPHVNLIPSHRPTSKYHHIEVRLPQRNLGGGWGDTNIRFATTPVCQAVLQLCKCMNSDNFYLAYRSLINKDLCVFIFLWNPLHWFHMLYFFVKWFICGGMCIRIKFNSMAVCARG